VEPRTTESLPNTDRNPPQTLSAEVPVGVDAALAEVLQQLDEEDEEASHGDTDDNDYAEDSPSRSERRGRAGVQPPSSTKSRDTKTRPKKYRKTDSGRIGEVEKDDSHLRSNCAVEADAEQLLEGLPLVWLSWKEFTAAFNDFQEATFQQFVARTSTSIATRNIKSRPLNSVPPGSRRQRRLVLAESHALRQEGRCCQNPGRSTARRTSARTACLLKRRAREKGLTRRFVQPGAALE
jgi:hypothetical protein